MNTKNPVKEIHCKWCEHTFLQKRSNQLYCSFTCKQRNCTVKSRKKRIAAFKGTTCSFCGFIAIDPCQLDIDHINGNHKDNNPNNLQTLCANCHRLKSKLSRDGGYKNKRGRRFTLLPLT